MDAPLQRVRRKDDPTGEKRLGELTVVCTAVHNGYRGCIEWTGHQNDDLGYGRLTAGGQTWLAHRLAYELAIGPIPEGLALDHLCRNPPCINPAHLDPVPQAINMLRGTSPYAKNARKTRCANGHPLSGENVKIRKDGSRICQTCRAAILARSAARALAEMADPNDSRHGTATGRTYGCLCPRCHKDDTPHHNTMKTHCPQGHPYTEANTYLIPSTGGRMCWICKRARRKVA